METNTMVKSLPTQDLIQAGQSPWLDFISREILQSGKLKSMIAEQALRGITSNPTIFEKVINREKSGYENEMRRLFSRGASTFEVYDALTLADIRTTCDLFLSVFRQTQGQDGFVSLEVMPALAHETEETIREAIRLFKAVHRPNVMIKVPATPAGIPAIQSLIAQGININVTLIFSLKQYQAVANAYLEGLEIYQKNGGELRNVHSVASVFVSRVDTLVDKKLEALQKAKAAIANSKILYQEFKRIMESNRFRSLQQKGATIQRVLWGSTSTKNPALSDLLYVENLVGPHTVNTMPQNTLEALLDHGIIRLAAVEENIEEAKEVVEALKQYGIDLNEAGEVLQREGVKSFADSFDSLMKTLELKREAVVSEKKKLLASAATAYSPAESAAHAKTSEKLKELQAQNFLSRFLAGDPRLWKEDTSHQAVIQNRMGWLCIHDWMLGKLYELDRLVQQIRKEKIKDVILLGMGGSSLASEVMSLICPRQTKGVRFHVLDTTDPANIFSVEKAIAISSALFIVASKSGSTIETLSQFCYFYQQVSKKYKGKDAAVSAGRHFIAITDEGSSLEKLGREKKFRKIFINPSDIGGRYSALSFFGMVPVALLGIDVREILKSARDFYADFEKRQDLENNPSVFLGVLLAQWAKEGRDKLTLWTTQSLSSFGSWLEQLIAESTGKEGKGILPIDGEAVSDISSYGKDRIFLILKLKGENDPNLERAVKQAKKAGLPLIEMQWPSRNAIGAEFLRWEIATAVSGVVLGINPFDEPNVKESKDNTGKILDQFNHNGKLQSPVPIGKAAAKISLGPFLGQLKEKGYVAILAYLERTPRMTAVLNKLRGRLKASFHVPVLVGFGPRYLHSIGQLYKGGPKTGIFLEFLIQEKKDAKIPGVKYTFGQLKKAQAFGDLLALRRKGLPVLAIDLGKDITKGLKVFETQLGVYLRGRKK